MRQIIITLFSILLLQISYANDDGWSVIKKPDKENYILVNGKKIKLELEKTNIVPQIVKIQKVNDHTIIVYFHAVTNGTFVMIDEIRGAIFNTKSNKLLGLYPYHYKLMSDIPKEKAPDQPIWKIDNKKIVIIEKELGLHKIIKIN